jgi:hypothetical protein
MTIRKIQISALIVLFFSLTAIAQSTKETVVDILTKSGSMALFKQIDAMIDSKISEKKAAFKNEEDFIEFNKMMKSGFNSTKAEAYYMEYYLKFANEDSLKNIIKLYNDPLMLEMSKLEEEANLPSKQKEKQDFFAGFTNNPPSKDKIQSLLRLNSAINASEMTVKLLENMILAMAKGANQAQLKDKQISDEEILKNLKNGLPENFSQQILNHLVAAWLFTYKDVNDENLNKYIQTWESPSGKYFSKSTLEALDYMFSKMGEEVGKSLGGIVK